MVDKEQLKILCETIAGSNSINPKQVEKDYYQTLFLQEVSQISDKLIFKGGTSLSKCYELIDRFSEDIDLSAMEKLTEGERRKISHSITDIGEKLGFKFSPESEVRSRGYYNKYLFEYQSCITGSTESLMIENNFYVDAYPANIIEIPNLISKYAAANHIKLGEDNVFGIKHFKMAVQTPERTLIDKIFALCDYRLKNEQVRHSRHIYDISQLLKVIDINTPTFKELFVQTRASRSFVPICESAQAKYNIREQIGLVINDTVYRDDYNSLTVPLLYKPVTYDEAIKALDTIRNAHFLDDITPDAQKSLWGSVDTLFAEAKSETLLRDRRSLSHEKSNESSCRTSKNGDSKPTNDEIGF